MLTMTLPLILILTTCVSAWLLTPLVRRWALRVGAIDVPGGRKIHRAAIPRLGGVTLVASITLAMLLATNLAWLDVLPPLPLAAWLPVGVGGGLVFLFGLWDDLRPLPAWLKFLVQGAAATIAISLGVHIDHVSALGGAPLSLGWLSVPLTLFWIVGLTNAFNLIDGLDGLAAGLGLIAASTSATIFFLGGGQPDGLFLLLLCGALAGFLRYNFHPASIFLGDSGSQFIGYVLAVTSITGSQKGATVLPVILPLLIFGLPLLDTGLSIFRRATANRGHTSTPKSRLQTMIDAGRRMCVADRDHVHHRLLAQGLSQRSAVLILYALATALSGLAIMAVFAEYRNAGAILVAVIVASYIGIRRLGYERIALERSERLLRWGEHLLLRRLSSLTLVDALAVVCSYWLAYLLKYDLSGSAQITALFLDAFPWIVGCQLAVLLGMGLYRGVWRALGVFDFVYLTVAIALGLLLASAILAIFDPPRSTYTFLAINGLLLEVLLVGARAAHKGIVYLRRRNSTIEGSPALIYGAGRRGECTLRELAENPQVELYPVGFIDDDQRLLGLKVHRVPVLGTSGDLPAILRQSHWVSAVIVSTEKIAPERLTALLRTCARLKIPVYRSDFRLDQLACGNGTASHSQDALPPPSFLPDAEETEQEPSRGNRLEPIRR